MKTKRSLFMCASVIVLVLFSGSLAGAADAVEWKGATAGNINHPYAQAGPKFLEIMDGKTGGKFTGKWYHSGQVGGEADIISQLKGNTLQFATVSAALAGTLNPKATTMFCPYVIRDWDSFKNQWVGSAGAQLILDCLKKDHKILGIEWIPYGFDALQYKDPPIRKLEDVKGRKLRSAGIYSIKETLEAMGANATPVPWPELYQACQQGVVDGFTTPPGMTTAGRLYEVVNNMTLSNHFFGVHIFWVRQQAMEALSPDIQKMVIESIDEACRWQQAQMKDYDENAIEECKTKHGMKIWSLSDEEMDRWVKATNKVWLSHEKKVDAKSGDGREFLRIVFESIGRNYDKEVLGQ
jgi:TRAP-type C4-dicarboxylate transport system substrate-binding protein